ncbi:TetR/AcrR family transcriptional regulator [Mycolicibacterium mucogenicum]|uniref:TetR/AcrR family transcriptional regulator n=1 Tax=Mycolicibacterium mucogenicum TaxID=56689 RepID=A0A4R5WKD8_MYCMU|nr:TetR/AcrR family transcriptional regulator [Mycolicibacterium mucogenicum]TDK91367.1 TetR/AcrR family transcriptional regulator [Mycolicibacterium mucogenicum]
MAKELGRPRDRRIDDAVLDATVTLLGEVGYAALSVDAIAKQAGTSKPAIYRRWPSKAHLVHEAAFPAGIAADLPDTGSLAGDVRAMVRGTVAVLSTPAARAALPGLLGEMTADATLHSVLLDRFADALGPGLHARLDAATARGELRADVTATDLTEVITGIALLAALTRSTAPDDDWIDRNTTLILKGIGA